VGQRPDFTILDINAMKIIVTGDGSASLYSGQFNETYHSRFGAVQESMHVFIHAGLDQCALKDIAILEIGFGTGLNALLTLQQSIEKGTRIYYYTIELYPLQQEVYTGLDYADSVSFEGSADYYRALHRAEWNRDVEITPDFTIRKIKGSLLEVPLPGNLFNVVFFDAFSPDTQPEMWTEEIFGKVYAAMQQGAVLTTYCVKGVVKRAMKGVGLAIEKLPGPPGKREMIRAFKR
jgi:tRNA U34 5-methylaminomethyl-2-thiouridine-forming methyltransferase MnmC